MSDLESNDEYESKLEEVNKYFKLPIHYNSKKEELKENIITDLELVSTIDETCQPICSFYFNTTKEDIIPLKITQLISKYYTTDVVFLKENQDLLKTYKKMEKKYNEEDNKYENIISQFTNIDTQGLPQIENIEHFVGSNYNDFYIGFSILYLQLGYTMKSEQGFNKLKITDIISEIDQN
jgi:hypothetical protein